MAEIILSEPEITDWATIILEAQTDPCGTENSEHFGRIYNELHTYLDKLAKNWLEQHQLSEVHSGAFSAIAWRHIVDHLHKFNAPDTTSDSVLAHLKAWIGQCCKRVWERSKCKIAGIPDQESDERHLISTKSQYEHSLEYRLTNPEPPESEHIQTMRRILNEELSKLPETMRDAILETFDLKDISNLDARGKQGDATEIANKYGYTKEQIRVRIHRLRKQVKARYEKEAAQ